MSWQVEEEEEGQDWALPELLSRLAPGGHIFRHLAEVAARYISVLEVEAFVQGRALLVAMNRPLEHLLPCQIALELVAQEVLLSLLAQGAQAE